MLTNRPPCKLPDVLKIANLQWNIRLNDFPANLDAFERLLEKAIKGGADIVSLPEMWTQSFCGGRLPAEAEKIEERLSLCSEKARKNRIWIAAGTFPEPTGTKKVFNTFHFFDPHGKVRLKYRKIHLFPKTGEPREFLSPLKNPVPKPFKSGNWNIGAGICYDLRFPELFRIQMKLGANLFFVPAQFPNPRLNHFSLFSCSRAIENLSYLVATNRCGTGIELTFPGNSQIIDPLGIQLSNSGEKEGCRIAEIDFKKLKTIRKQFPFLEPSPLLEKLK